MFKSALLQMTIINLLNKYVNILCFLFTYYI
nr:MAG TPA: hypothetical protein [Caudoviricetes sp.]